MAQRDYKGLLWNLLTGFLVEEDQPKAMLEWLAEELIRKEAKTTVGAEKVKHGKISKTHFSRYRVSKLRSCVGTLNLILSNVNTAPLRIWTHSGGKVYALIRR